MNWEYFEKFEPVNSKYLPAYGEGDNMATQIVTAVNKLIYKWYNDGDVFDNTRYLTGWANDLSSYANWLHQHTFADNILERVFECSDGDEYEELLADLADAMLNDDYLERKATEEKVGSIYDSYGPFEFVERCDDEDDEDEDY